METLHMLHHPERERLQRVLEHLERAHTAARVEEEGEWSIATRNNGGGLVAGHVLEEGIFSPQRALDANLRLLTLRRGSPANPIGGGG